MTLSLTFISILKTVFFFIIFTVLLVNFNCCSLLDFPALQHRGPVCRDWGTEVELAEQQEKAAR